MCVEGKENRIPGSCHRPQWNKDGSGESGRCTQLAIAKDSEGYEEIPGPCQLL